MKCHDNDSKEHRVCDVTPIKFSLLTTCKFANFIIICGDEKTELQIHHKKYVADKLPWESLNKDLITLCKHCHDAVTASKKDGGIKGLYAIHIPSLMEGSFIKIYYRNKRENVAFWIFKNYAYQNSFLVPKDSIRSLLKIIGHE